MSQVSRWVLATAFCLAIVAGEARAQVVSPYYPGYGGYGWGGWTAGATVRGRVARGLGYYNLGAGAYNRRTAAAEAIHANTVMRWNEYLYRAQEEANREAQLRREREQESRIEARESIQERLRKNPTAGDIENGDALNEVLDQVTDPTIQSTELRRATDPISGKAIREIPFFNATRAVTIGLDKLTVEDGWPAALSTPDFAQERKAYRQAIEVVIKEAVDNKEKISPGSLRTLRGALARLRKKLEGMPPRDSVEFARAQGYLKTLAGMTRLLDRPRIEKLVAELETIETTTLGSLLGFMETYNLRFGPATNPRQRAVYQELYPKLASLRDRILKDESSRAARPPESGSEDKPIDFFRGMHLDDLAGEPKEDVTAK